MVYCVYHICHIVYHMADMLITVTAAFTVTTLQIAVIT